MLESCKQVANAKPPARCNCLEHCPELYKIPELGRNSSNNPCRPARQCLGKNRRAWFPELCELWHIYVKSASQGSALVDPSTYQACNLTCGPPPILHDCPPTLQWGDASQLSSVYHKIMSCSKITRSETTIRADDRHEHVSQDTERHTGLKIDAPELRENCSPTGQIRVLLAASLPNIHQCRAQPGQQWPKFGGRQSGVAPRRAVCPQ